MSLAQSICSALATKGRLTKEQLVELMPWAPRNSVRSRLGFLVQTGCVVGHKTTHSHVKEWEVTARGAELYGEAPKNQRIAPVAVGDSLGFGFGRVRSVFELGRAL
jgi:hypothetical protein